MGLYDVLDGLELVHERLVDHLTPSCVDDEGVKPVLSKTMVRRAAGQEELGEAVPLTIVA